jgi:hypothetical protein
MSPASFHLVVRTGPNPGMAFELVRDVTVLGRDVGNDIVLGDTEISRQHARLTRTPGGYVLEDLGSTNGTFINGERLAAPRLLSPGDIIGLGENVTVMFDAISPEAAATVMGQAARGPAAPPARGAYPPPPAQRAVYPPPPQAIYPPPAAGAVPPMAAAAPQAQPKSSRTPLILGCAVLGVIVICIVLGYLFIPCEWLLPVGRLFGLTYCPP